MFVLFAAAMCTAQAPTLGSPVKLDLGVGGGLSAPTGTFADHENSGWHAGAKARISSSLPFNIVADANYHRLPMKDSSESDVVWIIGAGLELQPLPMPVVTPYIGLEGTVNLLSTTAAGSQSITREGIGAGIGVLCSVPALGNIDASIKYQILNLAGKSDNEDTNAMVVANVSIMFSVL